MTLLLDRPGRDAARTTLLVDLRDAGDERRAGGKAAALARLMALGVSVPAGVVLTCEAFETFLGYSALAEAIDRELASIDDADAARLGRAAEAIRTLVMAAPMPPAIARSIADVGAIWAGAPLAVRSSAIGEDGAGASFAGQFDSVLRVDSGSLAAAIRRCWASTWSARAVCYRRSRGLPRTVMAVLIQRQVHAVVAGVLFTRNPDPTAPDDDEMVLEYGAGLADRLVSGDIDPGRLYLSRASHLVTREQAADGQADARAALSAAHVRELAQVALRIEASVGTPQDIEWAIGPDSGLAIVQARSITTGRLKTVATSAADRSAANAAATVQQPTGPSERHDVLWSNANVSENFPEPVSPLLYSIASAGYYHYFRNLGLAFGLSRRRLASMEPALRAIVGVHGARLYYNLTNIHAVLRLAPCGERLAAAFNLFVGVADTAPSPAGASSWRDRRSRILRALEVFRIGVAVAWQFLWLGGRLRAFEREADEFADRTNHNVLERRTLAGLGTDLGAFMEIRCRRWKNASLCDTAAMVCYALLRWRLARRGFGDATHTRLLKALPGVPSVQPGLHLWALSRRVRENADLRALVLEHPPAAALAEIRRDPRFAVFRVELETFLGAWGFRSSGELMLTTPSLEEESEPIVALLRQYVGAEGESPDEALARQAAERRAETSTVLRAVLRRSPFDAGVIWLLLRWTQRAVGYRERARLKQALLYTRCRRLALRIGDALVSAGRVGERDAVFMLTWQEIDELCAGRGMFPRHVDGLVALRRTAHATESRLNPPDTIRLGEGAAFEPVATRVEGHPGAAPREATSAASVIELTGTTACGGRVSATAAVLAGVHEAEKLTRGDVLVTRQTDPGWAPVFCLISGIVVERGGMLSHGAIIAREFGLPCIVGVAGATARIPHGATVTLDADHGRCTVLP